MSALADALARLEAAATSDRAKVVPAAVAVLDALAVSRDPDVSHMSVLDRVGDAVGDTPFGDALVEAMFRWRSPADLLPLAYRYVSAGRLEEAIIAALGADDDTAAGAVTIQYDAWGYGAYRHSRAGARRVAEAIAALRARPHRSERLDGALSSYRVVPPSD